MRKVTVNCILSSFRKNKLKFGEFPPLNQEAVDLSLINDLDADELRFFIHQLSPGRKQVFIAHAIDGFTHKEIGEMLNISEGTSKSQFFDARKELKKSIENNNKIAK
jgi:RNA polymerase sigma-70 factor (ECF subfamily)